MDSEGHGEYPIRKRSLSEQCRWWEQRLLEQVEHPNRSVMIGAALFLGELAEKVEQSGG